MKEDTIAAVATPPGEGGIAVVRVSGPEARAVAARVFRPHRGGDPRAFPGYSVHYGVFQDAESEEVADDGLLLVFHAPHSYTGEDMIELSCHGGRTATAAVLRLALQAGARPAEPGEFTQRAFLNGRLDLAQAEAVADVIRARTETARRLARRQLDGTLSQAVAELKDELVGILAAIEVTIDFSDEVGDLDYDALESRIIRVAAGVDKLLATAGRGRILREGLRVAIVGRPNVGKSSLLNALLRAERAIVTPIAGTTRDLIEEAADIGGLPLVLIDTAGIRPTSDPVERIGVGRAESALAGCDVALLVLDASAGLTPEDMALSEQAAREAGRVLAALNKSDLLAPEPAHRLAEEARSRLGSALLVSALTGEGLEALEQALGEMAAGAEGGPGEAADSVVVSSERHRQALETARRSLQEAERTVRERLPGDFIAIDVRGALDALGLITGETVTEDIIHRIFRDFCVGK
ncbi:MAG TPA: tRNA uridine-5-carboxymethylaminomethyl(34) synthesis GTPase MnmE [Chthonomonadaceae bacterium]|nr:tRNA uridine-5-carboxymethylaminomethyl(34) synthesis GTPase MnmE [Chthonomonadaceae bacterium]